MKKLISIATCMLALFGSSSLQSKAQAEEVQDASCNTISDQSSKDEAVNESKEQDKESKENAGKAK